jgi:galactokinase
VSVADRSADVLAGHGMSQRGAALNQCAFESAQRAWASGVVSAAGHGLFVPGRIEVLGKHTDYAGGATLTCAVERGACAVYSPRPDAIVHVVDAASGEAISFPFAPDLDVPVGQWGNYPMTAAKRLARNFGPPLRGVDLAFHSTLPASAGLSSSSVLVTMTFFALVAANRLEERRSYRTAITGLMDIAGYLGSIENGQAFGALAGDRGVGTFGGSEDHTAMVCSEAGRLGYFAFCPVRRLDSVPVPDGYAFVVATSGIAATKTGNALERYNRASLLVRAIVAVWQGRTGRADATLAAVLASAPDAGDLLEGLLRQRDPALPAPADLQRRLRHFRLENEMIVPEAVRALAAGELAAFGRLVDESQHGAERLLGNQVPETVALARLARRRGAVAASAFGAGFGGSVWALVPAAQADSFAAEWRNAYEAEASRSAFEASVFFVTAAGPPVTRIEG